MLRQLIKNAIGRLPLSVRQRLLRRYYLRLVRDYPPDRWRCSAVVQRLLQRGDLAVDVGANVGFVAKLLSHWVGSTGRVVCLEPSRRLTGSCNTT